MARSMIFLLITLVLARTSLLIPTKGQSVVFVVDRSASIENGSQAIAFIKQAIAKKKPEDQFAIVSVGKDALVEQVWTKEKQLSLLNSVIEKHATNLESGLRLAGGLLSDEDRGRIVLMSDGKETIASAEKEIDLLKDRGIRIDVVPLLSKQGPEVMITDVDVPKQLHAQEEYSIKVNLSSTVATDAKLRLYVDDQLTNEQTVSVNKGKNQFVFSGSTQKSGFLRFRVEVDPVQDTIIQNNQYFNFSQVKGKPIILMIEQTPSDGNNLAAALEATGMTVERRSLNTLPNEVTGYKKYESIVIVNTPAFAFPPKKMELIRSAVKDLGIGLVTVGGEEAYALGGWFQTPLEEILPVRMDLQDQKRSSSLGLILVLDKSGSMAGDKIDLAKEAAARSTRLMLGQDYLALIAFDAQKNWVFKPRRVNNRNELEYLIRGIPASGGTEIYPALEDAYKEIRKLKTKKKHIILLTDGQSPEGKYEQLVQKMRKEKITLSTVAVGEDADQDLLQYLAKEGNGRYYQVLDPETIPTIISKETVVSKRSYLIEKPFLPQMTGGYDWKQSNFPPLRAYIGTTAKQTAEKVLVSPYPDPVLARWQYGLGRTVAWTSDLNGKWSKSWVEWSEFQKFWSQIISWTFPQVDTKGWRMEIKSEGTHSILRLFGQPDETKAIDQIRLSVVGDQTNFPSILLKPTSRESFEGKITFEKPGTYLLQAVADTKQGKKVLGSFALVIPYSNEYRNGIEGGQEKLQRIAQQGNGEILSNPAQSFAENLEEKWATEEVSFTLFLIAALLWPVDIAFRRLPEKKGLLQLRKKKADEKLQKPLKQWRSIQQQIKSQMEGKSLLKKELFQQVDGQEERKVQVQHDFPAQSQRKIEKKPTSTLSQLLEEKRKREKKE